MTISEIKEMPTILFNHHESVLKAFHILEKVKDMLRRKDSQETILEIIEECEKRDVERQLPDSTTSHN